VQPPVRIIWGEKDAWLDPSFARRLRDLLPNSDLQLIPGAGHLAMEDSPDEVARTLKGTLEEFFRA
jgi:pimeloyl-ACP methyl ester carboxylesterase